MKILKTLSNIKIPQIKSMELQNTKGLEKRWQSQQLQFAINHFSTFSAAFSQNQIKINRSEAILNFLSESEKWACTARKGTSNQCPSWKIWTRCCSWIRARTWWKSSRAKRIGRGCLSSLCRPSIPPSRLRIRKRSQWPSSQWRGPLSRSRASTSKSSPRLSWGRWFSTKTNSVLRASSIMIGKEQLWTNQLKLKFKSSNKRKRK